jgi:hypothetical protein
MLKKILPVITGTIGFALGGPMGASIGAGLGSAIRGDNPANIATSALMGYGLGAFGGAMGLQGGAGLGQLGASAKSTFFGAPAKVLPSGTAPTTTRSLAQAMEAGAKKQAQTSAVQKSLGQKALQFAKDNKLLTGALGLGALQGLGAFKEEEGIEVPPPPEAGSQGMLDISPGQIAYYDPRTRSYGAASPQIPEIYRAKDGGDIKNFPRKTGQIDGPGTEKSDDIPAMLSDGEFVMTAQAVRGLGALNGADKDDKLEQRRKGAKMMYEMMDKFESKVA